MNPNKAKLKRLTNLKMILKSLEEIHNVIEEGKDTHREAEWRDKNAIPIHIAHIDTHLSGFRSIYRKENKFNARSIEDISHAATRCLMVLQLILEEKEAFMEEINA